MPESYMRFHFDNQTAIHISNTSVIRKSPKHNKVNYHSVHHKIMDEKISKIQHV